MNFFKKNQYRISSTKDWWLNSFSLFLLLIGLLILGFPLYYTLVTSTLSDVEVGQSTMPLVFGSSFFDNMSEVLSKPSFKRQMLNSLISSMGITIGKIIISILSAYAITYFKFRLRSFAFWMIFVTLMLPVEVRILPTYEVMTNVLLPMNQLFSIFGVEVGLNWNLLDTYWGLTLPLIASATATFLFRQFFLTIPDEFLEVAKLEGISPMHFFQKIILPLSKTNISALFVIMFVYGWNQYLWPLIIINEPSMKTAILGVSELLSISSNELPPWNIAMAQTLLVMVPPTLIVFIMQKWLIKGLIDQEK